MKEDYENPAWLRTQMSADDHGILGWTHSGNVPSDGILERLCFSADGMKDHVAARDADLDAFEASHERRQSQCTREEIAE